MSSSGCVELPACDREVLEAWTQSATVPSAMAGRARIVLLAADGLSSTEIVDRVGLSRPTVNNWKKRYQAEGLAGLENRVNPGRPPRKVAEGEVVARTLESPPGRLGVTHWSTRLLGAELGLSNVMVGKVWRRWGLQPWKHQAFTIATVPELATTLRDSVGFYLHQPNKAVVLRGDEKFPIHAFERPAAILPPSSRRPVKSPRGAACRRPTTPIEAIEAIEAIEVATGQVVDTYFDHHRDQEFLRFLKRVAKAYPRVKLHVVVDGYLVGEHPTVLAWLERNPRITLHSTPPGGSWLNLLEVFLWLIIVRGASRRGRLTGFDGLTTAVCTYIDGSNRDGRPFVWIKAVEELPPGVAPRSGTRYMRL